MALSRSSKAPTSKPSKPLTAEEAAKQAADATIVETFLEPLQLALQEEKAKADELLKRDKEGSLKALKEEPRNFLEKFSHEAKTALSLIERSQESRIAMAEAQRAKLLKLVQCIRHPDVKNHFKNVEGITHLGEVCTASSSLQQSRKRRTPDGSEGHKDKKSSYSSMVKGLEAEAFDIFKRSMITTPTKDSIWGRIDAELKGAKQPLEHFKVFIDSGQMNYAMRRFETACPYTCKDKTEKTNHLLYPEFHPMDWNKGSPSYHMNLVFTSITEEDYHDPLAFVRSPKLRRIPRLCYPDLFNAQMGGTKYYVVYAVPTVKDKSKVEPKEGYTEGMIERRERDNTIGLHPPFEMRADGAWASELNRFTLFFAVGVGKLSGGENPVPGGHVEAYEVSSPSPK